VCVCVCVCGGGVVCDVPSQLLLLERGCYFFFFASLAAFSTADLVHKDGHDGTCETHERARERESTAQRCESVGQ
jgi:hypothetical protein